MIKKGDTIIHKLTGLEFPVSAVRLIDGQVTVFEVNGAFIKEEEIRKHWSYHGDSGPIPGVGSVWRHRSGLIGTQTGIISKHKGRDIGEFINVVVDTDLGERDFPPGCTEWTLIESAKEAS